MKADVLCCESLERQKVHHGQSHITLNHERLVWFRTIGLYGDTSAVYI